VWVLLLQHNRKRIIREGRGSAARALLTGLRSSQVSVESSLFPSFNSFEISSRRLMGWV
jgi:hypothetical protein